MAFLYSLGFRPIIAMSNFIYRPRFLGLKPSRFREWLTVLREGDRRPGLRGYAHMAWLAVKATLDPQGPRWRARMRACMRCPIYDRGFHRCQPYTGSPLGCGCFMPYKAFQGSCWLRDQQATVAGYLGWPIKLVDPGISRRSSG